jgi:polyisoprenoid-binding protein YceI
MAGITDLTPGLWNVDASHSEVSFSARHLMIAKVRGRFSKFNGTITVGDDPLGSTVTAEVDLASVDTGDTQRDAHLRSADFFDADEYPTMTFVSTQVTSRGGDYALTGDLTIRGKTLPVTFKLEFDGVSADPWGGTRAGFTAEAEINRQDWGLTWNVPLESGVLVSDKVKIVLDIEAVKA